LRPKEEVIIRVVAATIVVTVEEEMIAIVETITVQEEITHKEVNNVKSKKNEI